MAKITIILLYWAGFPFQLLNLLTTPKAKRKGAHDLFLDFLKKYIIQDTFIPSAKIQLTTIKVGPYFFIIPHMNDPVFSLFVLQFNQDLQRC
jgi:hypothetical protein